MVNFAISPLTKAIIIGGVVVLLVGACTARDHSLVQRGRNEVRAEIGVQRAQFIERVVKLKGEIQRVYITKEGETKIVYQNAANSLPKVPARPGCNITLGWMRHHDWAAAGDGLQPGGLDDPADSGIGETGALAVIERNYQRYAQVANDLRACRSAVTGLSAGGG
jgi:hypothetical protein